MAVCLNTQEVYTSPDANGGGTDVVTIVIVENVNVTPETCGMVALSGAEYESIVSGPFALTAEQGAQVGGAILLVWAIAWTIRVIARFLLPSHEEI